MPISGKDCVFAYDSALEGFIYLALVGISKSGHNQYRTGADRPTTGNIISKKV